MQIVRNIVTKEKSSIRQMGYDDALIVLVGLGNLLVDWEKLADGFTQIQGMDIFVPDVIRRESIGQSVEALHRFIEVHGLFKYQKVHVFAYILGGRILNQYLSMYTLSNLASIVYDRSPIQELAPIFATKHYPRLARLIFGKIIHELARTSYQPCPVDDIPIGLVIESKATPIMRFFKRRESNFPSLDWSGKTFQQPYGDLTYVPLNHNEMYWRFNVFIRQLEHFYQLGDFGSNARRTPFEDNPFEK